MLSSIEAIQSVPFKSRGLLASPVKTVLIMLSFTWIVASSTSSDMKKNTAYNRYAIHEGFIFQAVYM